jgi:hypothetical protein
MQLASIIYTAQEVEVEEENARRAVVAVDMIRVRGVEVSIEMHTFVHHKNRDALCS